MQIIFVWPMFFFQIRKELKKLYVRKRMFHDKLTPIYCILSQIILYVQAELRNLMYRNTYIGIAYAYMTCLDLKCKKRIGKQKNMLIRMIQRKRIHQIYNS